MVAKFVDGFTETGPITAAGPTIVTKLVARSITFAKFNASLTTATEGEIV